MLGRSRSRFAVLRDGGADGGDCGTDSDTVTADPTGIDVLTHCETILFPSIPGFGAAGRPAIGSTGERKRRRECPGRALRRKPATITGTDIGETIIGTPRRDVIDARGGDDKVDGLGGNDVVCGARGKDRLHGAKGRDTVSAARATTCSPADGGKTGCWAAGQGPAVRGRGARRAPRRPREGCVVARAPERSPDAVGRVGLRGRGGRHPRSTRRGGRALGRLAARKRRGSPTASVERARPRTSGSASA